jgi:hypothetical protein
MQMKVCAINLRANNVVEPSKLVHDQMGKIDFADTFNNRTGKEAEMINYPQEIQKLTSHKLFQRVFQAGDLIILAKRKGFCEKIINNKKIKAPALHPYKAEDGKGFLACNQRALHIPAPSSRE